MCIKSGRTEPDHDREGGHRSRYLHEPVVQHAVQFTPRWCWSSVTVAADGWGKGCVTLVCVFNLTNSGWRAWLLYACMSQLLAGYYLSRAGDCLFVLVLPKCSAALFALRWSVAGTRSSALANALDRYSCIRWLCVRWPMVVFSPSVLRPRTTSHHKEDVACVATVSDQCRNGWIQPCPRPDHPN